MKVIFNKSFLRTATIFFLFILVSFIFLKGIFFSPGILLGGDWGLPYMKFQVNNYFTNYSNAWLNLNLGSRSSAGLSIFPFALIFKLSSVVGLSAILFSKLLLLSLFSLAGFYLYKLLRFFSCTEFVSILGGMIYITTPLFFDYAIMGWLFVILAMVLFPVIVKYFIKSVKEGGAKNYIILSLLVFLSIQGQSIIWYFICFGCLSLYLVQDKNSLIKYLKTIFVVIISFILLNFYWLFSLLIVTDQAIIGSDVVKSASSLGTTALFNAQNIIRLFGSLYNFQYEYIIENSNFVILSFVLPFLAFGSLLLKEKKKKKLIIAFSLIAIVPFFFYFLKFHRDLLLHIPFSNAIRDFARFSVLSTFAYPVLIGFLFNYLFSKKSKIFKSSAYFFIILIFLSISPWWRFKISDWEIGLAQRQRFRTKVFSKEYLDLENDLSLKRLDQRALYFPAFGTFDIENDDMFHGNFQLAQDFFAAYSNFGALRISDKSLGNSGLFITGIKNNLNANLIKFIDKTNIKFIILRKNMAIDNKNGIIDLFNKSESFTKYFSSEETVVYEKKMEDYLSHFYVPESSVISISSVDNLPYASVLLNHQLHSAIYFKEQNKNNQSALEQIDRLNNSTNSQTAKPPILEFKKINPTKYRVMVHGASGQFPLVFGESFHDGWKMYLTSPQPSPLKVEGNLGNYKILKGNEEDQANRDDLADYINKGWITTLGNGREKEVDHQKWVDNQEKFDYAEKYNIDFVSKNFQGTIQNDNLSNGYIWETWFKKPIENNSNHLMVNGYANSWVIDVSKVCSQNPISCQKNPDGTYDIETVVEFWPQRLFYIGAGVSIATLLAYLAYLFYDASRLRSRKLRGNDEKDKN